MGVSKRKIEKHYEILKAGTPFVHYILRRKKRTILSKRAMFRE